jgi:hypothetical protein
VALQGVPHSFIKSSGASTFHRAPASSSTCKLTSPPTVLKVTPAAGRFDRPRRGYNGQQPDCSYLKPTADTAHTLFELTLGGEAIAGQDAQRITHTLRDAPSSKQARTGATFFAIVTVLAQETNLAPLAPALSATICVVERLKVMQGAGPRSPSLRKLCGGKKTLSQIETSGPSSDRAIFL